MERANCRGARLDRRHRRACARAVSPGRDPDHIEDLWQVMYRGGFFRGGTVLMSALSGVDQALWDIKGRRYGLSIYQFLGGAVRRYAA
ncbi:MAG TPA: hypothetical protein VLA19_06665 [Herpetosiphonaceae bacterium]|nr:hypothetical protein [Herpetosiphonaceae bacterium]